MTKKFWFVFTILVLLVSSSGELSLPAVSGQSGCTAPDTIFEQNLDDGIRYTTLERSCRQDGTVGPWSIRMLDVDPQKARLRLVSGLDESLGTETVRSMSTRYAALAALNAGYFRTQGLYRGEADGALKIQGKILSEPRTGRSSIGFVQTENGYRALFGRLRFYGFVENRDKAQRFPLSGINRPRYDNEIILYTPEFHRTTLTNPGGVEIIVKHNKVAAISPTMGSSVIPDDGFVLSASAEMGPALLHYFTVSSPLRVFTNLIAEDSSQQADWDKTEFIMSAGPRILTDGSVDLDGPREDIPAALINGSFARTAMGITDEGHFLFITVDDSATSKGMNLRDLADFFLERGIDNAVNLDGGTSTTMVVSGQVVNTPVDNVERGVSEAILLFPS